jgi:hypothetical protein
MAQRKKNKGAPNKRVQQEVKVKPDRGPNREPERVFDILEERKQDLEKALRELAADKFVFPHWFVDDQDAISIFLRVLEGAANPARFLEAVVDKLERDELDRCIRVARLIDKALAQLPAGHPLHGVDIAAKLVRKFGLIPAFLPQGARVSATAIPDGKHLQIIVSGNESRAIEQRHLRHIKANSATILVGSIEETAHGQLRCLLMDKGITIGLYKGDALKGRALCYVPAEGSILRVGAAIPEAVFGCAVREFTQSAWDDGTAQDTLWTVHGLRVKGTMEAAASADDKSFARRD